MASRPVFRIPNGIVSFLHRTGAMCVPPSNGIGVKRLQQGLRRNMVGRGFTHFTFYILHCGKRFYTLPHAAHGAIEDGLLKVWEDVESITGCAQFFIKSRHVSKVSEENAGGPNCVC